MSSEFGLPKLFRVDERADPDPTDAILLRVDPSPRPSRPDPILAAAISTHRLPDRHHGPAPNAIPNFHHPPLHEHHQGEPLTHAEHTAKTLSHRTGIFATLRALLNAKGTTGASSFGASLHSEDHPSIRNQPAKLAPRTSASPSSHAPALTHPSRAAVTGASPRAGLSPQGLTADSAPSVGPGVTLASAGPSLLRTQGAALGGAKCKSEDAARGSVSAAVRGAVVPTDGAQAHNRLPSAASGAALPAAIPAHFSAPTPKSSSTTAVNGKASK